MEIKPDYRQFVAEDRELLAMLAFLSGAVPVVYGRCEQLVAYTSLGLLVFVLLVCLTRYVMLVSHQWIIGDETLCTVKGVLARHTDYCFSASWASRPSRCSLPTGLTVWWT